MRLSGLKLSGLTLPGLARSGRSLPAFAVPIAPALAMVVGLAVALACIVVPAAVLEAAATGSGLASLIGAAQPPLGNTARMLLVSGLAGGSTFVTWLALYLWLGDRSVSLALPSRPARTSRRSRPAADRPVVRRADAHPDAPARRPLNASAELGTPFLEVRAKAPPAEQDIPADLDLPLSAFDPAAIPVEPLAWEPAPAVARASALEPGERLETFVLAASDEDAPLPLRVARWLVEDAAPLSEPLSRPPASTEVEEVATPTPAPASPVLVAAPAIHPVSEAVARPAPPSHPAVRAAPRIDPSESIHALLDRLERSVSRPVTPLRAQGGLQETLASLRQIAQRA